MGYVVGMVAVNFVPDGKGACAVPPERTPPVDESASAPAPASTTLPPSES